MPADFIIDTDRKMIFSKATGVLNSVEISDHMDRLLQHKDFNPEFSQLFDFREVTTADLTSNDIKQLAERTVFSANSRRAFVTGSDLHFGLARMFGIFRDVGGERGVTVFRDMNDAREWLSLPPE